MNRRNVFARAPGQAEDVGPGEDTPQTDVAPAGMFDFDAISDEEMVALEQEAQAAYAAGEIELPPVVEEAETALDEAMETPEEQAAEEEQGLEQHDAPTLATMAESSANELGAYLTQVEEMVADDESGEGQKLVDELEEMATRAEELRADATDAADADDRDGALAAAAELEEMCERALQIVEEAKALGAAAPGQDEEPPPSEKQEAPAGRGAGRPLPVSPRAQSTAPAAKPKSPWSIWAARG